MAIFKCKMCGGSLDILDGVSVATCEYCGTKQTVPKSTELYKNPRKYNGKKVCVTSWKVVSQLRSQTKAGTFYDFILCDDVSNYKDKSGVSLIRVYNYYQECIQPYNTPYIGALAFSDVIYTDISDERSMITVYGTFTYQSNTTEGDRYVGDPHVYNLDVDYYIE